MSTNTSDHTLLLQRHAKAEHVPSKDDIERELTAKGRRDAAAAGEWLTQQSIEVGLVLCSTAVRATQTWQAAASAGAQAETVRYDDRLYDAGVGTLLDVVQEVEDTAGVVLLVGHAPGIPAFATQLAAAGSGSAAARDRIEQGFPTAGLALLRWSGAWADLQDGSAVLEDFVVPRG